MSAVREPVTRSVPCVALEPLGVDRLRAVVGVRAVEQHDAVLRTGCRPARAAGSSASPRLGEDDGLLRARRAPSALSNATSQRLQQRLALGVVRRWTWPGRANCVEVGDLASRCAARSAVGQRLGRLVVLPFLGGLVERLVVLVELVFERLRRRPASASLALQPVRPCVSSAPAIAKVDEARSLRSTSVISERWLAGSACRLSRRRYSETRS